MEKYTDYIIDTAKKLLAIPSPTGFTHMAADFVKKELEGMGYAPVLTRKGAVLCKLGGKDTETWPAACGTYGYTWCDGSADQE